MANLTVVQGDSTPLRNLTATGYPDISSANWSGRAILASTLGGTAIISRALAKAGDSTCFLGVLTPAETLALAVGAYSLTFEIQNVVIVPPLKHQFQHRLQVTARAV